MIHCQLFLQRKDFEPASLRIPTNKLDSFRLEGILLWMKIYQG
jgi:hypothetical protein